MTSNMAWVFVSAVFRFDIEQKIEVTNGHRGFKD